MQLREVLLRNMTSLSDQNRPSEQTTSTTDEGTTLPPLAPTFNLIPPPEGDNNSEKRAGLLFFFFVHSFCSSFLKFYLHLIKWFKLFKRQKLFNRTFVSINLIMDARIITL